MTAPLRDAVFASRYGPASVHVPAMSQQLLSAGPAIGGVGECLHNPVARRRASMLGAGQQQSCSDTDSEVEDYDSEARRATACMLLILNSQAFVARSTRQIRKKNLVIVH